MKKVIVYTIGGIKGGSGKTTVATNLAVMLSLSNRKVLLIDADDQESATDFTLWRSQNRGGEAGYDFKQLTGATVRDFVLSVERQYSDIVIDTGGRDTSSQRAALTVSDKGIFPFSPRSLDLWTLDKLMQVIREVQQVNASLQPCAFLNRADASGSDNQSTAEALKQTEGLFFLESSLGNRKAFANAISRGLGVAEYEPVDKKAVQELEALFRAVTGIKANSSSLKKVA
jgi:chromosome partitioning protein